MEVISPLDFKLYENTPKKHSPGSSKVPQFQHYVRLCPLPGRAQQGLTLFPIR